MRKSHISVNTRPVADQYGNENIIEFSSPAGGGLISFTLTPDDRLSVHVYRHDMTVTVSAGEPGQPVASGNSRMDQALYLAAREFVTGWDARHPHKPAGPEFWAARQFNEPPGEHAERIASLISAARSWAADCEWAEDADDIADLTDAQVIAGVDAHYEGGWAAFVRDGGTPGDDLAANYEHGH